MSKLLFVLLACLLAASSATARAISGDLDEASVAAATMTVSTARTVQSTSMAAATPAAPIAGKPNPPFVVTEFARFDDPWAMTFLPDGRLLVTEKAGKLKLFNPATRRTGTVRGVPQVVYEGQGGLGDVILHPQFNLYGFVYYSYVEAGAPGESGAAVRRAVLSLDATGNGRLQQQRVIWRQRPKTTGSSHFSQRLAFDNSNRLMITSGDRQKLTPAQHLNSNLGKVIRLNGDGTVPSDNPFRGGGTRADQVWTLGHRNLLGIAKDANGRMWTHEMGPAGGDELNLLERGSNYGWPIVSNGDHYDGTPIPDHPTRPEFNAPEAWWTPVIAPSGFIIYNGSLFPGFRGDGFIGGLASQALIRIRFSGNNAREFARYSMEKRIREVEQGPDGAIWLLEDGPDARLLKLTPAAGG